MGVKVKRGADGVFECRLYLGRGIDGKARRSYKRFPEAKTEDEAQALADAWAANLTAFGAVKSARLVDLLKDYTRHREIGGASPNTVRNYRLFTRYVEKYLKNANARDLAAIDFSRFQDVLGASKEEGGQGLSANSIITVHHFLRGAYNYFVDMGICNSNPMNDVSKPSPDHHEASALIEWDFEELNVKIEGAITGDWAKKADYKSPVYAFAAWLALVTGMRVGEVCAVRRMDVDRQLTRIYVCGNVIEETGKRPYRRNATKGRKSRSVSITEADMAFIDAFVKRQNEFLGRGNAHTPLVTLNGSYVRPTSVSKAFRRLRAACGLSNEITFHSLRHTHATWLIMNGCDLKTLSERLGHADEATTLRYYGHRAPGRDEAAARIFEQVKNRAAGLEVCQK